METKEFYTPVFVNEHFIVVDKRPMVLSVPGRMGEDDERPVLGRILEKDFQQRLFPIHRLDFEVQGLIMFAKNQAAHKQGNLWFEKKEISKTYSALTRAFSTPSFSTEVYSFKVGELYTWKAKILRGKKRAYESAHGKDCLTYAKLQSIDSEEYFHWELNPVTGRSHQLRFELFRHGYPIVGDSLYGSVDNFVDKGIALRSVKIDFSMASDYKKFALPEFLEIAAF